MTVEELIKILEKYPAHLEVRRFNDEFGKFIPIKESEIKSGIFNECEEWGWSYESDLLEEGSEKDYNTLILGI
mgnify:CR=1 FL=1